MRLYFKQRFFSWFDSYDIYDEATGEPVFTVEGKLAWGTLPAHSRCAGAAHRHGEGACPYVSPEV